MKRTENPNVHLPRIGAESLPNGESQRTMYSRMSLDGAYGAWYGRFHSQAAGHAFKSWSYAPNAHPGSGTIHRQEDQARATVDHFMDHSVQAQREERVGHTLPNDRLEYVSGTVTIIDFSAQFNHYYPVPERPGEEPGSVGTVEAVSNGLGRFYLRREKRLEGGAIEMQQPALEVQALLEPLYTHDIHENYWGANDDHQSYPVASDVANAAFPNTWPPYEPRRLPQDEEQMVVRRRRAGLVGDPVAGKPNEEERLQQQAIEHLEAEIRYKTLPIKYE